MQSSVADHVAEILGPELLGNCLGNPPGQGAVLGSCTDQQVVAPKLVEHLDTVGYRDTGAAGTVVGEAGVDQTAQGAEQVADEGNPVEEGNSDFAWGVVRHSRCRGTGRTPLAVVAAAVAGTTGRVVAGGPEGVGTMSGAVAAGSSGKVAVGDSSAAGPSGAGYTGLAGPAGCSYTRQTVLVGVRN